MSRNAYCSECQTRVGLTESGECPQGHPRSALRDVREGDIANPARSPVKEPDGPSGPFVGGPNLTRGDETAAKLIGRLIVIVPATFVLAIGLYTGYLAGVQMGMSKLNSWLSSIGSMLLTGVVVAALVWDRRRKMRR